MQVEGKKHRVVIVGGGFAGIRAAIDLAKNHQHLEITLVSNRTHTEYCPSLYKVVTGRSPFEVCIPLASVFAELQVNVVKDEIGSIDLKNRQVIGGDEANYGYDSLILALGSQTSYFGIEGIEKYAFGMKSIQQAMRLKRHLHEVFENSAKQNALGQKQPVHIVVVGGGATGVELIGSLAGYCRKLAVRHGITPNSVIIDLVEAADRLTPAMKLNTSLRAHERLSKLGINLFLNTKVEKELPDGVELTNIKMKTQTLIWTAGTVPNKLYTNTKEFQFDKKGRVMVGLTLEAKGQQDVYILGDGASTKYSGYAQTAVYDGGFVAGVIKSKLLNLRSVKYQPHHPISILPIGANWALAELGRVTIGGRVGMWIRKMADLRFYLSILPIGLALSVFFEGDKLTETCPDCINAEDLTSKK